MEFETLEASALHWERLADQEEAMAAWNREHGLDLSHEVGATSVGDLRALSFRRTAQALRLEAQTGVWHCSCHLLPKGGKS